MSLVSWLTPWNPATIAMWPALRAVWIRPGVTSMMRALPWTASVMTPAWLPVKERASWPRFAMAMASRAIEMRSPLVSSMSSSRPGGSGVTWFARSRSSSVVSPMAETTTTDRAAGLAGLDDPPSDRLMLSASATEEPPYFCTTRLTATLALSTTRTLIGSEETVYRGSRDTSTGSGQ